METDELTYQEALDFVEKCNISRTYIYGIERFILISGNFVPDIDGILDTSSIIGEGVEKTTQAAKWYFSNYGKDTNEFFCIVFSHDNT